MRSHAIPARIDPETGAAQPMASVEARAEELTRQRGGVLAGRACPGYLDFPGRAWGDLILEAERRLKRPLRSPPKAKPQRAIKATPAAEQAANEGGEKKRDRIRRAFRKAKTLREGMDAALMIIATEEAKAA